MRISQRGRTRWLARTLALMLAGALWPAPVAAQPANPRARGLQLGYDLDHPDALAAFKEAIAADPLNPANYRLAAGAIWVTILFQQGAITVDDYLGETRNSVKRTAPDPDLSAAFRAFLDKAVALSEERLRAAPNDADAHYQVGAAYGFQATYAATVEGRVLGSFGPARRAYQEHERTLALDPTRLDAGLIVGLYRYSVGAMSAPLRLMARLAGISGGRDAGLRLVEAAARYPSDIQPNALFTLILLYNREGRYDDALRVIAELRDRFPRNRLLWLEAGNTALRAGRSEEARAAIERGLGVLGADPRPRGLGEESRWRFAHGAVLVALRDPARAEPELHEALAGAQRDWLRGRIHKELGKAASLAGRRTDAHAEFQIATRLCRADRDDECVSELKKLDR